MSYRTLAADISGPPTPGYVAVAGDAAPLLEGTLRRAGVPTGRDSVSLGAGDAIAFTIGGGAAAARADDPDGVASARMAVAEWDTVVAPRTLLLAAPRGFCAGVERAIAVVEGALAERRGTVYVRKQIVHNRHVVADLQDRGAVFVDGLEEVPDGATVIFSAHGVSPAVRAEAARRGLDVIDATCPLVAKVHAEVRRFAGRGDTVVLIGHAGHEEVEGTLGEAPDHTVLVESATDVERLAVPDPDRVSYLAQTTLAVDETTGIADALRRRYPKARRPAKEDICYASTNRQEALTAIAADTDLVFVLGSANSSNSRRLAELAERQGTPAHLIDDATEVRPEWLAGVSVIGLTAGASAPPGLVDELTRALGGLGPLRVEERETARETIRFAPPHF